MNRSRDLPLWLWVGLPLASIALRLVVPAVLDAEGWKQQMTEEWGIVQNLTVLFLLPAVVMGVLIFLRRRELPRGVGWIMLLVALAAFYFAGEEASWGQHWLGYGTPEALKKINTQDEFNVHNVHNIFNNVPRQLMLAATVIGGIILPLVLKRRLAEPGAPKSPWYWLIPNYRLMVISVMAIILRLPKRLEDILGSPQNGSYSDMAFFQGSGEFKEYCYALVIMFYVLSIYMRMGFRKSRT